MNRKLLENTTSVCSEKLQLFTLYFTHLIRTENWFFFQKDESMMRNTKRYWKLPENSFQKKTKKWPAASQRMLTLNRTHLPQTRWQSRNRLKSMFPCGRLRILSFKVLLLRGWQRASQTKRYGMHSLPCLKFESSFVTL